MVQIYESDTGGAIAVEYNGQFYVFAKYVLEELDGIVPHVFPTPPAVFEGFFTDEDRSHLTHADSLPGVAALDPERIGGVTEEDLWFTEGKKLY